MVNRARGWLSSIFRKSVIYRFANGCLHCRNHLMFTTCLGNRCLLCASKGEDLWGCEMFLQISYNGMQTPTDHQVRLGCLRSQKIWFTELSVKKIEKQISDWEEMPTRIFLWTTVTKNVNRGLQPKYLSSVFLNMLMVLLSTTLVSELFHISTILFKK